jgi:hypothetical protein
MPRTKAEPRKIDIDDITASFELVAYWMGGTWCPAVDRKTSGYRIRVAKSITHSTAGSSYSFDYFELDTDGTITIAPRGYAKDFKPGRLADVEAVADLYATPDPNALRIGGW